MKRQIDPNLNSDQEDILSQITKEKQVSEFGFADKNEYGKRESVDPDFKVTVVDKKNQAHSHRRTVDSSLSSEIVDGIKEKTSVSETKDSGASEHSHHHSSDGSHHHHHHHSSDGSHHHSSDGSHHHSSDGSHHHSSDGSHHHSSDGSHHHSSDGSHHHSSDGSHRHHSSSGSHRHHSSSGSHRHHSHHKHHKKDKKKKLPLAIRIIIAFFIIIALLFVSVFGTFLFLRQSGENDIKPNMTEVMEDYQDTIKYKGHTYKYNTDVFSVAFLGIDQEEFKLSNETDFVGASDADIVVTVDTKTGDAHVIAVPRDTMVDVEVYSKSGIYLRTEKTQLCLAYAYGDGAEQSCVSTMNAISRVLYSVPIQKYYALNLDGVPALNDAIGGVTVDAMYDLPEYGIKKGETVTLKGDAAKSYVRTRDMDKVDASLNRVDRQVQYIKAYSRQLVPAVMKDFSTVSRLYNTATNYSQTNLNISNATYVASLMLSKGITEFETHTISGTMEAEPDAELQNVVHAQFTPDEESLMETVLEVFYTQID